MPLRRGWWRPLCRVRYPQQTGGLVAEANYLFLRNRLLLHPGGGRTVLPAGLLLFAQLPVGHRTEEGIRLDLALQVPGPVQRRQTAAPVPGAEPGHAEGTPVAADPRRKFHRPIAQLNSPVRARTR